MRFPTPSEPTCGSTPFDDLEEFGCVDSYPHDEKLRPTWYIDCPACGVTLGFGGCHVCLAIACEAFRNEDELDEF